MLEQVLSLTLVQRCSAVYCIVYSPVCITELWIKGTIKCRCIVSNTVVLCCMCSGSLVLGVPGVGFINLSELYNDHVCQQIDPYNPCFTDNE